MAAPMCLRSFSTLTRFSRAVLINRTNRRSNLCELSTTTSENKVKSESAPSDPSADTSGDNSKTTTNKVDETKADEKQKELLEVKEKLMKENEKLQVDFKDMKDKYMRALAETENVRTRMKKQVEEAKLFGIQGFCKDLLEVADILNKAMDSVPKEELDQNQHLKSLYDGLTMTSQQMIKVFSKNGLVKIDPAIGDKFDPFFHEALFQVPATGDSKADTIADIQKTGYKLHERTIRPALVGVFKS